jgi:putative methyltransferase (TIGR04325 family)
MTAPRVFEGTYGSFAEVPHQTGYNSETYLRDLLAYCEERADELVAGVFPRSLERNIQTSVLIATVAAMLGTGKLRILDFGGGLGQTFVTLAAGILNCAERLDYIVCDLPDTIAYLRAHDSYEARGINCVKFVDDLRDV